MIKVENLSKTFKLSRQQKREMGEGFSAPTIDAVKDVSFICEPGRVYTLLGPNGAGKTTVLRMIATMLQPTFGSIEVCGYNTVKQPDEVRKRLGFLTGNTGLYHRLTPNEFVKYFADLHGMDSSKFNKRKDELFTLLGIHEFAQRRIGKLSTGMLQKVSIVRTIIHDPEVIVFDEPTSGLDIIASKNIIELIRSCIKDRKTVIFSTHRMDEVSLLSTDLGVIHKGNMLYDGTFQEFLEKKSEDTFENEFIKLVEEN